MSFGEFCPTCRKYYGDESWHCKCAKPTAKWQTWLCEKCGVSHAMNETRCFHCSHPKPAAPSGGSK